MTATHYETLGVAPGAEDAVIRAAYRALMRQYHPDTNPDPHAQARVREITAAFFVLGNPARRAAYDAAPQPDSGLRAGSHPPFFEDDRRPPPMRGLGLAAVALALALTVTVSLWPAKEAPPQRQARPVQAAAQQVAQASPPVVPASEPVENAEAAPTLPVETAVEAPPMVSPVSEPPLARPKVTPARALAPRAPPAVISPKQAPRVNAVAKDDRRAEVERLANGFLQQSLAHADASKRQLLLSAGVRSSTSRNLCRSDDCVTNVYLRQVRETTAIMEGRVPGQ